MKNRYKILIVDDEPEITKMLHDYFAIEGYEVEAVNSPVAAMARIEKGDIRILITDITMPEMSGTELIGKVKEFDGLIQVIVITGYVTIGNILTAFRKGANNCFFKPFGNLDEIREEVDTAIRKMERIIQVLRQRGGLKSDVK